MSINKPVDIQVGISDLREIIRVVKGVYGFDFSHYAVSSFQRRVIRVMTIYKFKTIAELLKKIRLDKDFYDTFLKEITVNTTEMFRDPSMWRMMKEKIIEELKTKISVKIWHAGCSSGEEVFSMAILLKEAGLLDKVKLIATDINTNVIERAKSGIYTLRNMETNEANYKRFGGSLELSKYYKINGHNAHLDTDLLKNVTFKVHNLALEESFSKFDLVLCRNVMIYFDKVLQDKVFKLFHASLYSNSFFVIGSKESLIWCSIANRFKVISEKERIYKVIA